VVVFLVLFLPLDFRNGFETPARTKYMLLMLSYPVGVLLMSVFLWWDQQRWYWWLTEDALVWGVRQAHVIPLSSVEKIVPGRPIAKGAVETAFGRGVTAEVREGLQLDYGISLLLLFKDGSMMPFHIHRCVNGTRLMTALLDQCRDRMDNGYHFSDRQRKQLRFADWNRLTRPVPR
jgi:hypothetical protein